MPIILPSGTVELWQTASRLSAPTVWDASAQILTHAARAEPDPGIHDDLCTLVHLACQHADDASASPMSSLLGGHNLSLPFDAEAAGRILGGMVV